MEATPDVIGNMTIHERMVAILTELPAIGKTERNTQQNFMFRGIDNVLNALNPLLAKWGVFYLPKVIERLDSVRQTSTGKDMYVVCLHVLYTFYGVKGDSVTGSAWGEGTDMGDKATNKAMTGAMKYALFQAFAISTEEAYDSDFDSPEQSTRAQTPADRREAARKAWGDKPLPEGWDDFDSFDEAHVTFAAGMELLTKPDQDKIKAFRKKAGIGWPMTHDEYDACLEFVRELDVDSKEFAAVSDNGS